MKVDFSTKPRGGQLITLIRTEGEIGFIYGLNSRCGGEHERVELDRRRKVRLPFDPYQFV